MNPKSLVALALGCVLLAGCNRRGPEIPKEVQASSEQRDAGDGIESVVVNPEAAHAGSAIDQAGDLVERADQFAVGQSIYVSVPTKFGLRDGQTLEIFWFHDDGRSRKDETRKIEGPFTAFEFVAQDAGKYNVEVAASGRPIALVQFEVR